MHLHWITSNQWVGEPPTDQCCRPAAASDLSAAILCLPTLHPARAPLMMLTNPAHSPPASAAAADLSAAILRFANTSSITSSTDDADQRGAFAADQCCRPAAAADLSAANLCFADTSSSTSSTDDAEC